MSPQEMTYGKWGLVHKEKACGGAGGIAEVCMEDMAGS